MYGKLVERESNSFPRYSLSSSHPNLPSTQILERNKEEIQSERNSLILHSNMGRNRLNIHINGIVAFHDIVPGPAKNVGGVPKFWKEIKDKYDSLELVKSWGQEGYGIGILYM